MLSALKNFGVTFLISALLFGVIAYFATGFVTNTVSDILEEENKELNEIISTDNSETDTDTPGNTIDPSGEELKVPTGESFNFLIATTDYRPDIYDDYQPTSGQMYQTEWGGVDPVDTIGCLSVKYRETHLATLVLVRIDREKRQFIYTYISPSTGVYTPTGYKTLSEVYNISGLERITEYVYALTGLKPDYTAEIEGYNLDELVEVIGSTDVTLGRDIYSDGMYNCMQYETVIKTKDSDGKEKTEKRQNTYLLGQGTVTVNSSNIYTILTAREHSTDEFGIKERYTIEMLGKYLLALTSLGKDELKIKLSQLILKEDDWSTIEGLDYKAPEKAPETEPENSTDDVSTEEETKKPTWSTKLEEPNDAILHTNFSLNSYDDVFEMLEAVSYFENVTISYPVKYMAADDNREEYFEADINSAVETFMEYRK